MSFNFCSSFQPFVSKWCMLFLLRSRQEIDWASGIGARKLAMIVSGPGALKCAIHKEGQAKRVCSLCFLFRFCHQCSSVENSSLPHVSYFYYGKKNSTVLANRLVLLRSSAKCARSFSSKYRFLQNFKCNAIRSWAKRNSCLELEFLQRPLVIRIDCYHLARDMSSLSPFELIC